MRIKCQDCGRYSSALVPVIPYRDQDGRTWTLCLGDLARRRLSGFRLLPKRLR